MDIYNFIIIMGVVFSFIFSLFFIRKILIYPSGNSKMVEISDNIKSCAKAYLKRQYLTIFFVSIWLAICIYFLLGKFYVLGFFIGACFSSFVGYVGMLISVNANVRTANAANLDGLAKAFDIAFKAGSVTGLLVIGFGLLGIFLFYNFLLFLKLDMRVIMHSLIALGLGASFISVFARLGGGIFTKGADIGADLVGKLEIGIPEDDPRNPAVIADNVGDNVGDCAGMAADLYETYCVTIIAAMVLLFILSDDSNKVLILYPLIIGSFCVFSTIIGVLFVKLHDSKIMRALYKSFLLSAFFSLLFIFFFIKFFIGFNTIFYFTSINLTGLNIFCCSLVGIILTFFLVLITEYYTSTSFYPVRNISSVSTKGHAPNIIQGLAFSMESTALPVFCVILAILISYSIGGIIGVSLSAASMVSLSGIIVTLDAYGPVTDNAGGIAEMANMDHDVRIITDSLDAVGNTTKAITKGYAIGSAGLGSLVLFITYTKDLEYYFPNYDLIFSLKDPFVIVGLFFGGIIPYLFSAFSMRAVGNVAGKVVDEVRYQFLNLSGIMQGSIRPDYEKVIDLLTKASIAEMVIPATFPVIFPVLFYLFIYFVFGQINAFVALGSMILGIIIIGIFLAISMTSGGGAWDNAKKYIEDGNFGGKGSFAHQAAVTGDMVGDPYKDTAGPAINPLIKVVSIISLLLIVIFSKV